MRVFVKKWGNSAAVRIPVGVMDAARMALDDEVEVREEGGRILIEPVRVRTPDLSQLLAGITPENLHDEIDCGPAVGREAQ
jgi:antitoxin MazE